MKKNFFILFFFMPVMNSCGIFDPIKDTETVDTKTAETLETNSSSNSNQECQKKYNDLINRAEILILNDQNTFEEKKKAKKILSEAKEKCSSCNLSLGSKAIKINDYCIEQAKSAKTIYENTKDNDFNIQYKFYTELSNLISNVDNK